MILWMELTVSADRELFVIVAELSPSRMFLAGYG